MTSTCRGVSTFQRCHGIGGPWPQSIQEHQPPELPARGEHGVAGGLERAIAVEQTGAGRPGLRVSVHELNQRFERALGAAQCHC